jgi:hypothetical protein
MRYWNIVQILSKMAVVAKVAKNFERDFCFVSSKDQIKMCKMTILSSHALLEKNIDFVTKRRFLNQKAAKLGIQKQL